MKLLKKEILQNHSNILDIGSNDGTFLNFFAKNNKKLEFVWNRPICNSLSRIIMIKKNLSYKKFFL